MSKLSRACLLHALKVAPGWLVQLLSSQHAMPGPSLSDSRTIGGWLVVLHCHLHTDVVTRPNQQHRLWVRT